MEQSSMCCSTKQRSRHCLGNDYITPGAILFTVMQYTRLVRFADDGGGK